MILAHTSAEAQLNWQSLLYHQPCEVNINIFCVLMIIVLVSMDFVASR